MSQHSQEQKASGEIVSASVSSLPQTWDRTDLFLILLILLVSALLRLLNLDYMKFKGDEANNLFVASYLALGRGFPLVGMGSSIGTYNPPLFTYLLPGRGDPGAGPHGDRGAGAGAEKAAGREASERNFQI